MEPIFGKLQFTQTRIDASKNVLDKGKKSSDKPKNKVKFYQTDIIPLVKTAWKQ